MLFRSSPLGIRVTPFLRYVDDAGPRCASRDINLCALVVNLSYSPSYSSQRGMQSFEIAPPGRLRPLIDFEYNWDEDRCIHLRMRDVRRAIPSTAVRCDSVASPGRSPTREGGGFPKRTHFRGGLYFSYYPSMFDSELFSRRFRRSVPILIGVRVDPLADCLADRSSGRRVAV